jgi:hypothetical protein
MPCAVVDLSSPSSVSGDSTSNFACRLYWMRSNDGVLCESQSLITLNFRPRSLQSELVLADDVRPKAIGVSLRPAFGIGKQISLAMRMLKRPAHLTVFQPATPAQDGLHVGPDGMPHPHARLRCRVDGMKAPAPRRLPVGQALSRYLQNSNNT